MLRHGMWVVDQDGRVGLFWYAAVTERRGPRVFERRAGVPRHQGKPEFHVVDEHGRTILVMPAYGRELTQARADQIPATRRPTKAALDRFGYA